MVLNDGLNRAKEASSMESFQSQQELAGALRITNAGVRTHKLQIIDIPGGGTCQFHAFVKRAHLD
eukprot:438806-Pyramimonas_sp.AAC.1